ncbi:MAG: hypothetical protein KOO66_09380 [Bacteroidales bacterium]|nr:hypothetical protein [Bacteroidales bacterium]
MKNPKLTGLSLEELEKKHKNLKLVAVLLVSIIILFSVLIAFSVIELESSYLYIFPVVFIPNLLINFLMIKKIRTEIESRK